MSKIEVNNEDLESLKVNTYASYGSKTNPCCFSGHDIHDIGDRFNVLLDLVKELRNKVYLKDVPVV